MGISVSLALAGLAVVTGASASPCAAPDAETRTRAEALAERAALLEEAGRHADAARAFAGSFKLDCSRPELLLAAAQSDALASRDVTPDPSPPPSPQPVHRDATRWVHETPGPGPWVVMSLGATMVGTSAALIVAADKHIGQSEVPFPAPTAQTALCVQAATDRVSQAALGAVMRTDGILIGGLGVASLVGGVWWYFAEGNRHRLRLSPSVGAGTAGASLGGDF
jgi:hypothetical protein